MVYDVWNDFNNFLSTRLFHVINVTHIFYKYFGSEIVYYIHV